MFSLKHLSILFLLIIFQAIPSYSEKLESDPIFDKLGKNFFQCSKKIFFVQCNKELINDKVFLVEFGIYTNEEQEKQECYRYNISIHDFQLQELKESGKLCCELNSKYKLYIWSERPFLKDEIDEISKTEYTILSDKDIKKNHNYITAAQLSKMRLFDTKGVSLTYTKVNEVCSLVFFDSDGYAFMQYCPRKGDCCKVNPDKPDIKEKTQRNPYNPPYNKQTIKLPRNFEQTVTIDGERFLYIFNFGYVQLNKSFSNNNSIILSDSKSLIMRLISQESVLESPIQCKSETCKYSLPEKKSFSKKIIFRVNSSTKNITPVAILNDRNVLELLKKYSKPTEQEINYFNAINGFINDYNNLNINSKNEFLSFIEDPQTPLNFPHIPDIPNTLIVDEAGGVTYCTATKDICFHESDKILNLKVSEKSTIYTETYSNQWDDQFTYYKTPILYTKEYIFQSIENELFKKNICKSSENKFCYKAEMDKRKFGFWLIFDDFKHDENRFLKILHNFKVSDRFYNILLNAHNNQFRIDRIQGYRIEQIFDIRKILNNSTFPNVSDLEALIDLNDHQTSRCNAWELHLVLGRNTSKRIHQKTKEKIMKRLDDLNVKRIVLWEFSDTRTFEKTIYNKTFEDIQQIKQWKYKYSFINHKSEFKKISIPLYQN